MAKVVKSMRLDSGLIKSGVRKLAGKCWVFLLPVLLWQSCRNEIEIFTEYKEMGVVYGLLDLGEETQYVKVGRTFLNPDVPVREVAQEKDSLYFEEVIVKLIEEQTGREILLHKTDSVPKDSGFFQNQSNVLYATREVIRAQNTYRLFIQNPKTGYTATGRTVVVHAPVVSFPVSTSNPFWSVTPELSIQLRFANGINAKSQNAYFEFWVAEFPESDTTQKTIKKLSWRFVSNLRNEQMNPASRVAVTPGMGFYEFFLGNLENGILNQDPTVQRRIVRTDFVLYSASQDLTDYIDASTPSIGIVQKQTDFTNVENALGLFSSRYTTRISNVTIDEASIGYFNDDDYPQYKVLRMIP